MILSMFLPASIPSLPMTIRPADRRERILSTAAAAFSSEGYAATRLSDIADEVGISTPALYRHFDTKYRLFSATVEQLSRRVDEAVSSVRTHDDPRSEFAAVLTAFTDMTFVHRAGGNLYRWEDRVLRAEDRSYTRDVRIRLNRRLRALVEAARPDIDRTTAQAVTIASLSVAASATTHRAALGRRAAVDLLSNAAARIVEVEVPQPTEAHVPAPGLAPTGRREAILAASVRLFADRGFHEVTVDHIGNAVGLPASGVYRHFSSKSAILAAALWRTADRTTDAVAAALAQAQTPSEAVVALAERYSELCVDAPDIMTVYMNGIGAVDESERRALRRSQRLNVDEWAAWVVRARPEVTTAQARFLVHASLNVATDLVNGQPGIGKPLVAAACAKALTG